jgi:hypothetical protein
MMRRMIAGAGGQIMKSGGNIGQGGKGAMSRTEGILEDQRTEGILEDQRTEGIPGSQETAGMMLRDHTGKPNTRSAIAIRSDDVTMIMTKRPDHDEKIVRAAGIDT